VVEGVGRIASAFPPKHPPRRARAGRIAGTVGAFCALISGASENRGEATLAAPDKRRATRRGAVSAALHDRIAARRTIADQTISLAHLLGRRVLDAAGSRVGKVSDLVVRWDANVMYPPVVGILVGVGRGFAFVDPQDVTLTQTGARLRSEQQTGFGVRAKSRWPVTSPRFPPSQQRTSSRGLQQGWCPSDRL
jgi:sporulation protein YlmC with PRC-barrel domain